MHPEILICQFYCNKSILYTINTITKSIIIVLSIGSGLLAVIQVITKIVYYNIRVNFIASLRLVVLEVKHYNKQRQLQYG